MLVPPGDAGDTPDAGTSAPDAGAAPEDAATECVDGGCEVPVDCASVVCEPGTRCDPSSGVCVAECADGSPCGVECDAGFHECGGVCVADDSAASCGTSCTPCPSMPNAVARCESGGCVYECTAGTRDCSGTCMPQSAVACGDSCTRCETPSNGWAECRSASCAVGCYDGYYVCGSSCPSTNAGFLDTRRYRFADASLAVDAAGDVHAVYRDGVGRTLVYSHRGAGAAAWTATTLASGEADGATAIAVVSDGSVHIVYGWSNGLAYARRAPDGTWSTPAEIDSEGRVVSAQLRVDGAGQVHVAYVVAASTYAAKYARRDGAGAWTVEALPYPTRSGAFEVSLALDASGTVHVALGQTYLRRPSGGAWSAPESLPGFSFRASDLSVDSAGTVHAVGYESGADELQYVARAPAGGWTYETVDSTVDDTAQARLGLDASGRVHVVYFYSPVVMDDPLRYAWRSSAGGWRITTLARNVEQAPAVAVAPSGQLHVGYFANGYLVYAHPELCLL